MCLNSRLRAKWLVIPAIWLAVAMFNVIRDYFLLLGSNRPFSLAQALPASLFYFGMWALLSPFILWFAQVLRIKGRRWVLKLAAHVLLSILFAIVVRTSYEYDVRGFSRRFFEILQSKCYPITGGEVNEGSDYASWRRQTDKILQKFFPLNKM